MRVIFHTDYDVVTLRAKNGTPRATVAYKAGPAELTVKRDHGEAAIRDGAATEVKTVVRKPARGGVLPKSVRESDGERGEEIFIAANPDTSE